MGVGRGGEKEGREWGGKRAREYPNKFSRHSRTCSAGVPRSYPRLPSSAARMAVTMRALPPSGSNMVPCLRGSSFLQYNHQIRQQHAAVPSPRNRILTPTLDIGEDTDMGARHLGTEMYVCTKSLLWWQGAWLCARARVCMCACQHVCLPI